MKTARRCTRCNTTHPKEITRCPKCSRVLIHVFVTNSNRIIQLHIVSALVLQEIVGELVDDIEVMKIEVASLKAEIAAKASNEEE